MRRSPALRTKKLRVVTAVTSSMMMIGAFAGSVPATAQVDSDPVDLRERGVFAMSNSEKGNEVVAFSRNHDGTLEEVDRFDTGGRGSGSFEDTANGLVLGTARGEAAPNNLIERGRFLFVTNAGSNSISVFEVRRDSLKRVEVQASRGEKPVSVTVNDGHLYVLNSGETNDNLFDRRGDVIDNCTTGKRPSVTGFKVSQGGKLNPIQGSRRYLSGERVSGCAQVSFHPEGNVLVVTERFAQPRGLRQVRSDNERLDDEGVLVTFKVGSSGRLKGKRVIDATGQGPFGFTFKKDGDLLTTEQQDGPFGPRRGTAASYVVEDNGSLIPSSPSIQNLGTDTCWFVATDDQTLGFSTSFFFDGRISSYALGDDGIVNLLHARAADGGSEDTDSSGMPVDAAGDDVVQGASDMSLSRDSDYLYQLNSIEGTVNAFHVNADGTLTHIDKYEVFDMPPFGPGGSEAAPIGLASS